MDRVLKNNSLRRLPWKIQGVFEVFQNIMRLDVWRHKQSKIDEFRRLFKGFKVCCICHALCKYLNRVKIKHKYFHELVICFFILGITSLPAGKVLAENDQNETDALNAKWLSSKGEEKLKIGVDLANQYKRTDFQKAIYYANNTLETLKTSPNKNIRLQVYSILAAAHLQNGDNAICEEYAQKALTISQKISAPLLRAETLNILGAKNLYEGKHSEAQGYFQESLDIKLQQSQNSELSPSYSNLGIIQQIKGHYNRAIEYYILAIDHAVNDTQLARPISNLGVLNQLLNNYDKALHYYKRSLELKLKKGDAAGAALAHNNISEILRERAQFKEAEEHLLNGLAILQQQQAPQQKALLLVNLANNYLDLNNTADAQKKYEEAVEINKSIQSPRIEMLLFEGLARLNLNINALSVALDNAQKFQQIAERENYQDALKNAYHLLYTIYERDNQIPDALASLKSHNAIKDELLKKENSEYVSRLQEEFESEKKEKELALLQNKNANQELEIGRKNFLLKLSILSATLILLIVIFILRARSTRIKTSLLEEKVAKRTEEIANQNTLISSLLQQKEELLEHKNELFSMVSHEFRTPLTLITGPLDLLFKSSRNNEVKHAVRSIKTNANRLLRMVDQLLDLARLDQKIELQSEKINISDKLNYLIVSMDSLFREHQLEINSEIESQLYIDISNEALEKIIVNLLSNAVKYTPAGGEIFIRAFSDNNNVVVEIKDSGIGLAEADKARIFQRFTRLKTELTKHTPGAGVGLALVKEFMDSAEGNIRVESELHKGSTFILEFPGASAPKTEPTEKEPKEADTINTATSSSESHLPLIYQNEIQSLSTPKDYTESSPHIGDKAPPSSIETKPNVLVVEDHEEMRHFIENCLKNNFNCSFAEDGKLGIKQAVLDIPDLIITDLMMPNADGYELASTIRNNKNTCHIPILMLTAKSDSDTRITAWQKNIDEFIEKPFAPNELLIRCENLLSIRQLIGARLREQLHQNSNKLDTTNEASFQINEKDQKFVEQLNDYLENNFSDQDINAKSISSHLAMTEKQLQRKIKALTQETIPSFVRNFRLNKSAERLTQGQSITNVALDVGFSSQNYFSTAFSARFGCTPSEYKNKHTPQSAGG